MDSAVLRLDRVTPCDENGDPLPPDLVRASCAMADAAFASRRKTLANSCKTYFAGRGKKDAAIADRLGELFEMAGVDPKRRGETLEQVEFVRLGKAYLTLSGDDRGEGGCCGR